MPKFALSDIQDWKVVDFIHQLLAARDTITILTNELEDLGWTQDYCECEYGCSKCNGGESVWQYKDY